MSKITLNKISKILGISKSTVSKALNDYDDVSPKTKQIVQSLAEELNYKPNAFAQSLRNQESKIIGLIIPEIVHYFFSNIAAGVIKTAEMYGYTVILLQSDEDYDSEIKQIDLLLDKNVDGILLSLADNTVKFDHITDVIDSGIPVVLYDKISKLIRCHKVVIDDIKAAYMATQHLIDTGCKRIAIIRNHLKPQTTIDRYKGYKKALEANGIHFDETLDFQVNDLSFAEGKRIANIVFNDHKDVDGVFAITDLMAIGALEAFKEKDVRIPEQVSIIGFSNWFLTQITTPHLSTIDQPGFEMGKIAFNFLYQEINNRKNKVETVYETKVIPTKVIIRESTK